MWFKTIKSGYACRPLIAMDPEQTARYKHFRDLLDYNRVALNLMADLEQTYYDNRPFTMQKVERKCDRLLSEVELMVQAFSGLSSKPHERLSVVLRTLLRYSKDELRPALSPTTDALTLQISRIGAGHDRAVGAKAANLARTRRELGLPVPEGFAVTTAAYWQFLLETGLSEKIDDAMAGLVADDPASIESIGREIRALIIESPLPRSIREAIEAAAADMAGAASADIHLAVRSSAIGEDGEISFAGQYTSILNVPIEELSEAYKQVVASKYSASALSYRLYHGVDDRETPMAVLVLQMIRARLSGVLYTADPVSEDRDTIQVNAVQGLGDALVGGDTSPQRTYRIAKSTFKVLEIAGADICTSPPGADASETAFLRELWQSAKLLEDHFQRPLDIEWAVDEDPRLYILQARPLLLIEEAIDQGPEPAADYPDHPMLIDGGKCAAGGVVAGRVLVVKNTEAEDPIPRLDPDTILVAPTASTYLTPWVAKVKGIITDVGGVASHLASVAREFGVPALFDTQTSTATLTDGGSHPVGQPIAGLRRRGGGTDEGHATREASHLCQPAPPEAAALAGPDFAPEPDRTRGTPIHPGRMPDSSRHYPLLPRDVRARDVPFRGINGSFSRRSAPQGKHPHPALCPGLGRGSAARADHMRRHQRPRCGQCAFPRTVARAIPPGHQLEKHHRRGRSQLHVPHGGRRHAPAGPAE